MSAELLTRLRERGFALTLADGRLRVEPASKLTPADRALIRHHLAALRTLLSPAPPGAATISRPESGARVRLQSLG